MKSKIFVKADGSRDCHNNRNSRKKKITKSFRKKL